MASPLFDVSFELALKDIVEELVLSLERFVSYRTVSSQPEFAPECRRAASFLRNLFKQFGAETALFNTADQRNPIVFARFEAKHGQKSKGKSILFCGHYDVVPADNKEGLWKTDPFQMQGINGYLYGRGVSDNKGPVLAALYAVADVFIRKELTSNVVFLIEGEQECGSRCFQKAVKENKRLIGDVGWILLANSYWLNDDIPCLTYGLRGVIHATIEMTSEQPDLHSGVDGSQLINEPLKDLVTLLASLNDSNGKINIPGFFDDIPDIDPQERDRFDAISRTLILQNPGLGDPTHLARSFRARWREPSLTIHRIDNSGRSNLAIIARSAKADISIRLVPKQTSAGIRKALEAALTLAFKKLNSSNTLTIRIDHQAEPWLGDPNNQIFRTLDEAIMEVWKPVQPRPAAINPRSEPAMPSTTPRGAAVGTSSSDRPTTPEAPKLFHPATSSTLASPTSNTTFISAEHHQRSSIETSAQSAAPKTSTRALSFKAPKREATFSPASITRIPPNPSTSTSTSASASNHRPHPPSPSSSTTSSSSFSSSSSAADETPTRPPTHSSLPPSPDQPLHPLYIREGGSIPALRFLETEFSAPAAHFPCGQASDAAHLDNERLRLINLYRSREIFRRVFVRLGS